ncbi:C4-dicarboxylate transporter/malic acid transporter [Pleurostoma richardsiae]|uniref:C4-dicarboxylate transporter/malic acid transporter n=1 Tax=Pleurostoma richardsiae TaxID=41990 RepID=A0AA38RVE0_9PEZI|nr:C4-dicarboxylate transporter/malic acid transporter [Pleurostoma richardsiae]
MADSAISRNVSDSDLESQAQEKQKYETSQDSSEGEGELTRAPSGAPLERVPTYLQPRIPLRERLHHFTFAWYTVTMSTGGIALVFALCPHRFRGLDTIGLIIFLLDLLFFLFISAALCLRFILHQRTFSHAMCRPGEALFISTFFLSIAALLSNAQTYGELFLNKKDQAGLAVFLRVAFWIYLGATFLVSVIQYHILFTVKEERRLTVNSMTPAWILPIFPVMLAGTIAGFVSPTQPPDEALAMICAGVAAQGLGMLVSVFMYATYLSRLIAFGLPVQRPGMFIAVGPPSFTCAAIVAMASDLPRIFAAATVSQVPMIASLSEPVVLAEGVKMLAITASIFLWGLAFWFFVSALAAIIVRMPDRRFHLSWWSFVFPNVGFTIAAIRMGVALDSGGILWMSTVMIIVLFVVWAFVAVRCVRAVLRREILWPGKDEDCH